MPEGFANSPVWMCVISFISVFKIYSFVMTLQK
jgi:hypothetical protein